MIRAPWTREQVRILNDCQQSGAVHPFTCGGGRGDDAHIAYSAEHGGDLGQLVATADGWVCPVPGCGYTQDWAHAFMVARLPAPPVVTWNLYEVLEDEWGALYWVVASDQEEAAQAVIDVDDTEGGRDGLSVSVYRAERPFALTFTDGFDDDVVGEADAASWRKSGFEVAYNDRGQPVVTGTAKQWANHHGAPAVLSCSEWD